MEEEKFRNIEESKNPEEIQNSNNLEDTENQDGAKKSNKYSGQFLQTQIFNTSKRIKKTLSQPSRTKKLHQAERDAIKDILE
jgi:hypothetical protein